MTDNEIKKTEDTEVNKIKAIYPHIVVGGIVNKPCYSIDWYDIEAQTMHTGYSSYNLKNVQEWLKEHFEVVEYDIENLINRLQAEVERLEKENENFADIGKMYSEIKSEAYKEFVKRLEIFVIPQKADGYTIEIVLKRDIDNLYKELVGD